MKALIGIIGLLCIVGAVVVVVSFLAAVFL